MRPLKGLMVALQFQHRAEEGRLEVSELPLLAALSSAPGLATLVALAILVGLGTWQLQRKAWKEDLIAQIEARTHGAPGEILPEAYWAGWRAGADEFRRVRLTGTFLHEHEALVHGPCAGERGGPPIQGFYLFTPLRLAKGGRVMVNRGFVPTELRDPASRPQSRPQGEAAVTGLVRAPECGELVHARRRASGEPLLRKRSRRRSPPRGTRPTAPFYVDADATPNPGGWPQGGQTRLDHARTTTCNTRSPGSGSRRPSSACSARSPESACAPTRDLMPRVLARHSKQPQAPLILRRLGPAGPSRPKDAPGGSQTPSREVGRRAVPAFPGSSLRDGRCAASSR